jgi:very-short-patch-repair endonuclease
MAGRKLETIRSSRAWEMARQQHGVVARRDLLALGFSASAVEHRVASGRLHPLMRGVYAVGLPRDDRRQEWMAAVLACGDGACLSHGSAAALWRIGRERGREIDLSVLRHCDLRRQGLRVRVRCRISRQVTEHDGIPVTKPAQTILDSATELAPSALERMVNEADKWDLIDPDALRVAVDGFVGQPGVVALRTLLDRHTFRLSDTELEVLFRPLADAAGLPVPLTKQIVNGFEVDFHWPDLGLVIETDGWRYHRTPAAQSRDALRDQVHTASGLTPLRFSHYQVKYEPAHVRDVLRRTVANLRR